MPLSAKEKEKIIEDETLRLETRIKLQGTRCAQACAQHGRCRHRPWLAILVVLFFCLALFQCTAWHHNGPSWRDAYGSGMMMDGGQGGWRQAPAPEAPVQKAPSK